ncbi:hypothetical protein BaRGS_00019038 [Batillaria attramentaria]|uniref:Uncharacterized protein n=1 Tax=Batillaria attramentaria TaxID=370345 RepID=A0ABD0KRR8_9CAEN
MERACVSVLDDFTSYSVPILSIRGDAVNRRANIVGIASLERKHAAFKLGLSTGNKGHNPTQKGTQPNKGLHMMTSGANWRPAKCLHGRVACP